MTNEPQLTDRHRRVVAALQHGPAAPASLRRRIARREEPAAQRRRLPLLRGPMPLATGVATALAVALAAALLLGGPAGPTAVQAAELSKLPATAASPAPDPRQPALLASSFAGVRFPDWSEEFGWRTAGRRSDTLAGRDTETVFYTHAGHRIGYTVVGGDTIDPPDDAETVNAAGFELHRFRAGGQDVVTFVRDGRTCVLAGHVADPRTLVKLAAYRGHGEIDF